MKVVCFWMSHPSSIGLSSLLITRECLADIPWFEFTADRTTVLTIRHQTYTLAWLAASMLLTSCVIPIPPHHLGAEIRRNLGERVPDFIVPTVTTREAVLMHLGEADGWSQDES